MAGLLFSATLAARQGTDDVTCKPTLAQRAVGAQVADDGFSPELSSPAFPDGRGPRVLLDEGHSNFHTIDGRYGPFVRVLRRDGFVVEPSRAAFTAGSLATAQILVIANPDIQRASGEPYIPARAAFSDEEIIVVRQWVSNGGSLFLIADHLPWGGTAATLAEAFGLLFSNGYATDARCEADEFLFERSDGALRDHPITRGRNSSERVNAVQTITGQAFRSVNPSTRPVLVLAPKTVLLLPTEPWRFTAQTPRYPPKGCCREPL